MSYIILLVFLNVVYVIGAPVPTDSLKFRIVECNSNENETLSKYVIEVTNINETCIKVNQSLPTGNEIFLHVVPQLESGIQIHIIIENCSIPLPPIHLSLCDDDVNLNNTLPMITYRYDNNTFIDFISNDDNSTIETYGYTGPLVYETAHHLDQESDEDNNTTVGSLIKIQNKNTMPDTTSEESEEKDKN